MPLPSARSHSAAASPAMEVAEHTTSQQTGADGGSGGSSSRSSKRSLLALRSGAVGPPVQRKGMRRSHDFMAEAMSAIDRPPAGWNVGAMHARCSRGSAACQAQHVIARLAVLPARLVLFSPQRYCLQLEYGAAS